MKTIMLMRHGAYDFISKSLHAAGRASVEEQTERLIEAGFIPDVIHHSPVKRAIETAHIVKATFNRVAGKDIQLVENGHLHENERSSVEQVFSAIDDGVTSVMAVSHEPNVAQLSGRLDKTVFPLTAETNVYEAPVAQWAEVKNARWIAKI